MAEHSLFVEWIAEQLGPSLKPGARLAVLLHDGHEYVVGDMISPFKRALGEYWRALKSRLQGANHLQYGLPRHLPRDLYRLIHRAGRAAAHVEAVGVGKYGCEKASRL